MTAENKMSAGQFLHGTRANLNVGDIVKPSHYAARATPEDQAHNVFMTDRPDEAQFYADSAMRSEHGYQPTIYRVEPLGPVEHGPNHGWGIGGEFVTPAARVTEVEPHTYKWPGQKGQPAQIHHERDALRAAGTPGDADKPQRQAHWLWRDADHEREA